MKNRKEFLICIALLLAFVLAACGVQPKPEVNATLPENLGQAEVRLPGTNKVQKVSYEIIGGRAIFQGDMILGQVDANGHLVQNDALSPEGVATDTGCFTLGLFDCHWRWPNGVIPFELGNGLTTSGIANIRSAIAEWETKTPINFVEFAPGTARGDFIQFIPGSLPNACASWVGRSGGRQTIELTPSGDCSRGALIHEIGHAVGLYHEQSRQDRDSHVKINWNNIQNGMAYNFDKVDNVAFDVGSYDFKSIMHYGATAFSKNGLPTIETLPAGIPIGQRSGLSFHDIGAVNRLYANNNGTFNVTNAQVQNFPAWAANSNVKIIPGDFNGDKRQDMALVLKTSGWASIPIAFSNGNGTFNITNGQAPEFASWASNIAVEVIPGNFNNDSCTDLALVNGTPGWASIPVAFSNCDGTFNVTNFRFTSTMFNFPLAAADILVKIIPGDFNKDGRTDLALVRQAAGWASVPVAFSNGNGSFTVTNSAVSNFPAWAADLSVKIIAGDYNGDGRTDMALVRQAAGWASVPVAFSNGNGTFNVTNQSVANFPGWAADTAVKIIPGDFNGDGKQDLALVRRAAGWKTTPIAFSTGNGSFEVENEASLLVSGTSISFLADLVGNTSVQIITGDYNGDKRTDLALVKRTSGWNTIPIAFSNADGSFNMTNQQVPNVPSWATNNAVQVIGGDFDANGKSDLSLVLKAAGWSSIPVAFKN